MAAVKVVAMTQEHRGHGTTTAAYFLSQSLAQRQIPVLLGDLTGRHTRLPLLHKHFPTRNLVLWVPPPAALRDLPALVRKARSEVAGHATCIVLDVDLTALETLATVDEDLRTIDYLLVAEDYTTEGEKAADRLAARFAPLRDRNRFGLAFARIAPEERTELPEQTDDQLPILGYWPADYRLATADEMAATGTSIPEPHQAYLDAMTQLAARLARLVPLSKIDKQ